MHEVYIATGVKQCREPRMVYLDSSFLLLQQLQGQPCSFSGCIPSLGQDNCVRARCIQHSSFPHFQGTTVMLSGRFQSDRCKPDGSRRAGILAVEKALHVHNVIQSCMAMPSLHRHAAESMNVWPNCPLHFRNGDRSVIYTI